MSQRGDCSRAGAVVSWRLPPCPLSAPDSPTLDAYPALYVHTGADAWPIRPHGGPVAARRARGLLFRLQRGESGHLLHQQGAYHNGINALIPLQIATGTAMCERVAHWNRYDTPH